MANPENIVARIGGEGARFSDGTQVSVVTLLPEITYKAPGEVSWHESGHGAPNPENVRKISKVPSGNALGWTLTYEYDDKMVVGPHADGCGGTGHDMDLHAVFGGSYTAAASAAKPALRSEFRNALAGALEAYSELEHDKVIRIRDEVRDGKKVLITETLPNGEKRVSIEKVKWNVNAISIISEHKSREADL